MGALPRAVGGGWGMVAGGCVSERSKPKWLELKRVVGDGLWVADAVRFARRGWGLELGILAVFRVAIRDSNCGLVEVVLSKTEGADALTAIRRFPLAGRIRRTGGPPQDRSALRPPSTVRQNWQRRSGKFQYSRGRAIGRETGQGCIIKTASIDSQKESPVDSASGVKPR